MLKMSNRIAIRPEELRDLATNLRDMNIRILTNIKDALGKRKEAANQLSDEHSKRETKLYEQMFEQVDHAGLSALTSTFADSYHMKDTNFGILNRATGHKTPGSMTDRYMMRMFVPRNEARFRVSGSWGDGTSSVRNGYSSVTSSIDEVMKAIENAEEQLDSLRQKGAVSRHFRSSTGFADETFISVLNAASDYAIEAFEGLGARSDEKDAIVATVQSTLEALEKNLETINDLDEELTAQANSLASDT